MPELRQPTNAAQQGLLNSESTTAILARFQSARVVIQAAQEIEKAEDENQVFSILESIIQKLPYDCAIFDVGDGVVQLLNYYEKVDRNINKPSRSILIDFPTSLQLFTSTGHLVVDCSLCPPELNRLSDFLVRLGFSAFIGIQIHAKDRPVRLLTLSVITSAMPTDLDLYPYDCLVAIVCQALVRIQDSCNLKSRLDNLETLAKMGETISLQTDLSGLYELIHRNITDRLGEDLSFAVAIYRTDTQEIEIPYLFENNTLSSLEPFPLGEGLTSHLIQTKKSLLLIENTEKEAEKLGAKIIGKTAKSWLGVPLIVNGEVIGAIIAQDTNREGRFSERDRAFLETLAPQLGIAIRNTQLLEQMNFTLHKYDQEQFLLNSLLENIPEKVYFKDSDGQYIRVSRSWINQYPIEQAPEFLGKTDLELFSSDLSVEQHNREMEAIATTQASIGEIAEKTLPGGETYWEWISRIPLVDETGHAIGLLGISQNISDLKNAEIVSSRRAQQILTASEIARDTTGSLDTSRILNKAVNLIRERFNFYHASVFLVDPENQFAVLQEASGMTGEMMKKIGHRLAVGSNSLVGQATAQAMTVVVNDTRSHPDYYPNPLLPETCAEVVVPLKIGSRVLGALDVQSDKKDAFLSEDLHTLEILADQLAIGLENANLFSKTQEQIAKQKLLRQMTTTASTASDLDEALQKIVISLHDTVRNSRVSVYFNTGGNSLEIRAFAGYEDQTKPDSRVLIGDGTIGTAASQRQPIRFTQSSAEIQPSAEDNETRSALAVPIIYLDNLLGVLSLESFRSYAFDENDEELIGSLGDSLGVIIANIRLLLQIRKQMDLQEKLFDISGKIRQSVDVESILRTTAQEIGRTLGFSEVVIQLASPDGHEPIDALTEAA